MAKEKRATVPFKFEAAPLRFLYIAATVPYQADFGTTKGKLQYSATAGIPVDHPELKNVKAAAVKCARDQFGPTVPLKDIHFPFKDGDNEANRAIERATRRGEKAKDTYERCRGYVMLRANTPPEYPPALCVFKNGEMVDIDENARKTSGAFYPGVEGYMEVNFVAYNEIGLPDDPNYQPRSVACYLRSLCSLNRGKNLGGGSASRRYANVARNLGQVSQEDVTKGLNDEIEM